MHVLGLRPRRRGPAFGGGGGVPSATLRLLFDADDSNQPRLFGIPEDRSDVTDPETNKRGAQLAFTSHDTSLLNGLNRDEVWLTEKAPDASTQLVGLAEFGGERVRKSLNLERAYLQGRFGAVPEVDQITVRRALGLFSEPPNGQAD